MNRWQKWACLILVLVGLHGCGTYGGYYGGGYGSGYGSVRYDAQPYYPYYPYGYYHTPPARAPYPGELGYTPPARSPHGGGFYHHHHHWHGWLPMDERYWNALEPEKLASLHDKKEKWVDLGPLVFEAQSELKP